MLGTDLTEVFRQKGGQGNTVPLARSELDITSVSQIEAALLRYRPKVLINAAAYTNVDGAEKERELAFQINAVGPKNLASVCRARGITLVHFSSDYVFNGENNRPWTEQDLPHPVKPNYYAETKLAGERAVLEYPQSLVLRVQWLYGKKRDRFSPLRNQKTFTPLVDQVGAPTWTKEVAETVFALLERQACGLFQMAYDDSASWMEVFQFVKEQWNLPVHLIPKKSSELQLPAKRPLYCVLSNRKLCETLGKKGLGSWKQPLAAFLDSLHLH